MLQLSLLKPRKQMDSFQATYHTFAYGWKDLEARADHQPTKGLDDLKVE
jgi:hypothetical protein